MADEVVESLLVDLLDWVAERRAIAYEEVMDAWRTSCPKLPVWEEANARGLLTTEFPDGRCIVTITSAGQAFLKRGLSARNGIATSESPASQTS